MTSIWINGDVVYIKYYWVMKYPNVKCSWLPATVGGSIFAIAGSM